MWGICADEPRELFLVAFPCFSTTAVEACGADTMHVESLRSDRDVMGASLARVMLTELGQ